jgi:BMFP domain-containing protein YqiC
VFEDLVQKVSQQTGITTEKARQAVDTVVAQIKTHMPPAVSTHIDELMAGNFKGTVADVEQKFKEHFGGLFTRK